MFLENDSTTGAPGANSLLTFGFARVPCSGCGRDDFVAFSCKGRGFCPSCGGRRMADSAAHLVDEVLPDVPVRQWVLSFPFRIRYLLAYDPKLCCAVRRIFVRSVLDFLERQAQQQGHFGARSGAVVLVQRFGEYRTRFDFVMRDAIDFYAQTPKSNLVPCAPARPA